MFLLNTLDLFCIQVGKCIWQDLEVLRLRSRVRGLVVLVIYTQLSSIETDVENATAVAYQMC